MMENDNHLEQSSKDSKSQPPDYLHIKQNTPNPSVPGEAKLAHLEHRPPSEGLKTRVSVPGECQERKYTHSTVRNGKEMAVFLPLRTRNNCVSVMWTKMVGDSDKSGWWLSFFNSPF